MATNDEPENNKTENTALNKDKFGEELELVAQTVPANEQLSLFEKKAATRKASNKTDKVETAKEILSYRHNNKRANNPHVGMVDTHSDAVEEKNIWHYDPHIDPALNFDSSRAAIEKLIDGALASGDKAQMHAALEQLKRMQSPYLNWTGKAERTSFEVDTVSLHVHERIDPATILAAAQSQLKNNRRKPSSAVQPSLFHAPFENLPLRDAIDFYRHDRDWSNRLIAGDSLLVMNSLLQKESMAGKVQMIYIDPPYGIKYGSNFQPFVNKRDVKDRKDEDLTQEPEMIKAFRDTWELGIHSYLTYLRDRLLLARELLNESGSVFVQISDENVHHVRELMDEVFGVDNFVAIIPFVTTSSQTSALLPSVCDFIIWFGKNKEVIKYRELYKNKDIEVDNTKYKSFRDAEGRFLTIKEAKIRYGEDVSRLKSFRRATLTSQSGGNHSAFEVVFNGRFVKPSSGFWKTNMQGITRLKAAGRIAGEGKSIAYIRYFEDFAVQTLNNVWEDHASVQSRSDPKVYVVQTATKAIQRCMLMTTDPGDLVLDPTCGSGTTAMVSEKWGRRWITCDTSRVAVTLAKQRLMTASYDYYELKYPQEGLKSGFIYKTVPHVTLKSIANNPEIDAIYERMYPAIEAALEELNQTTKQALREWEVPFDFPENDDHWPQSSRKPFDAFHAARQAMQRQMDMSIAAHADTETLYDQPTVSKDKLRISGPFTVEAVPFATVLGLDEAEQPKEADIAVARSGATSRHSLWRDELLKAGIRGKGGQKIELIDLAPLPGARYIHAVGTVVETGDKAAVSFGPEHAALEQRQVEIAMREAGELFPLPKILMFCAFTFDPEAAKDIDLIKGITALKAQMNTDLLTKDLKKGRASNESFWLMGQPDVLVKKVKDDCYQVEVRGFDYFDTKTGELKSGGKKNIAMWSLDTDYDNRSLFPRQVFFPIAGGKEGWNKLRKDIRAELNEDLLEQFHGTVSLPFSAGEHECIAVKIVDDRGIESLKVIRLDQV